MLKSLHNFAANGRVSPVVAKIAGFAGICIVGTLMQAQNAESVCFELFVKKWGLTLSAIRA